MDTRSATKKETNHSPENDASQRLQNIIRTILRHLRLSAAFTRLNALTLEHKFLLTASLVVGISMATLGYWVEKRMRAGWTQGMAETGALYLEGFLAHHVQALEHSNVLPPESQAEIEGLLHNTRLGNRVAIIKLWDLNGHLIFSTNGAASHEKLDSHYIARIKAGEVVVDSNTEDHADELKSDNLKPKLIEIYAPIYKQKTNTIIAIGEFYEYDKFLKIEIRETKLETWLLIISVALVIMLLLYLIASAISRTIGVQQDLLEANLVRAAALAKRNNVLRRAADRARLNAAVLNEAYLATIGADIHDGPIQMLSLMILKLPGADEHQGQPDELGQTVRENLEPLIQQTLSDLRNLSAGLVLPEIEDLSTRDTIDLAITRHEHQTGTPVARDLADLPDHVPRAIRVCAYRVVQEALNNAYKHAGGHGQRVSARIEGKMLEITVADSGETPASDLHAPINTTRLGLRGMDSRVKALRGSLSIVRLVNGGTEIQAVLPLRL